MYLPLTMEITMKRVSNLETSIQLNDTLKKTYFIESEFQN